MGAKPCKNTDMHRKQLTIFGITLFVLFLVSYKFSLLHTTQQLSYLNDPAALSPFQRLFTYTFMMIGVPPTTFMILYMSILCHTELINGTITTICFGTPFALAGSEGFYAYGVASLLAAGILTYVFSLFSPHSTKRAR